MLMTQLVDAVLSKVLIHRHSGNQVWSTLSIPNNLANSIKLVKHHNNYGTLLKQ